MEKRLIFEGDIPLYSIASQSAEEEEWSYLADLKPLWKT